MNLVRRMINEQDKDKFFLKKKGLEYKISSLFFGSFCKCQNCYAMF